MKTLVSACPIEQSMQLLSGRWPMLIVYHLRDRTKRFSELRKDSPAISHRMLTLELRKLENAGVVTRTDYTGYPLRVEYALTETGRRLLPIMEALGLWWESKHIQIDPTDTA